VEARRNKRAERARLQRKNTAKLPNGSKRKRKGSRRKKSHLATDAIHAASAMRHSTRHSKARGPAVTDTEGTFADDDADSYDAKTLFSAIDKDGNGVLDKQELLYAVQDPELIEMIQSHERLAPLFYPKTFAAFFTQMDANSDGVVDFAEFKAALAHSLDTAAGIEMTSLITAELNEG